jgi:hypothetical protein
MFSKLRIRSKDKYNWVIEGYEEGGGIISRGPHMGKEKKGGWQEATPIGYFSTLEDAATRMIDEQLKLDVANEVYPNAIVEEIRQAKQEVLNALKEMN